MRISHVEFHLTTYAGVNQDEDPLKANDTKITLVNDLCGSINLIEWIHKNNSENGINDKWATKTAEKSQPKYVEKKKRSNGPEVGEYANVEDPKSATLIRSVLRDR